MKRFWKSAGGGSSLYAAPSVERLTVATEKGFASSLDGDSDYDVKPGLPGNWDDEDDNTWA